MAFSFGLMPLTIRLAVAGELGKTEPTLKGFSRNAFKNAVASLINKIQTNLITKSGKFTQIFYSLRSWL
jgi:hypothetical protein